MYETRKTGTSLRSNLVAAAVAFLLLTLGAPAHAAIEINERTDLDLAQFVPCANSGLGEFISGTGTLHTVVASTVDSNGILHRTFHSNFQNFALVGDQTGDVYQVNFSATVHHENDDGVLVHLTREQRFLAIGPGPDNNFEFRLSSKFIVNGNGDVILDTVTTSTTCD